MITIESRTQGDHEELKIFSLKILNFFTFQSKVVYKKEGHLFIEKLSRKLQAVRFAKGALDGRDHAKLVGHDPMTRIPLLSISSVRSSSVHP